jgi:hypothetical protein
MPFRRQLRRRARPAGETDAANCGMMLAIDPFLRMLAPQPDAAASLKFRAKRFRGLLFLPFASCLRRT